jgi:hypothetical protein
MGSAVGCYDAQFSLYEEWIELASLVSCKAGAFDCVLLEHKVWVPVPGFFSAVY